MYIPPNTNIRLLSGVPLTPDYNHTLFFSSINAQTSYFISKTKPGMNLSDQSFQRVKNGVARIGVNLYDALGCNYLMFQNPDFGNKWFYAFITEAEYVNNGCTEIRFEIDVMQSWLFDFTLDMCYVIRSHVANDTIGANIEPESLEPGEYVFNSYEAVTDLTDMCVIIGISDVDETNGGNTYNGIYSGIGLYAYSANDSVSIDAKINQYLQKPDAIVSMYVCPTALIGSIPSNHVVPGSSTFNPSLNYLGNAMTSSDAIDGYIPKNNKLYTFPYNFFHVDNGNGQNLKLRYEFFQNFRPQLVIKGNFTQPVELKIFPDNYKRVNGLTPLMTESLSLNGYPLCQWNVDTYKAWVAQNTVPNAINFGSNLLSAGSAFLTGNPIAMVGAGISMVNSATNLVKNAYQASVGADISKGSASGGGVNIASKRQQFYCGRASISIQRARTIDDYFSAFGYAINRLQTPDIGSRPVWNFIQLLDPNVSGSVPAQDMKIILQNLERGITFWKSEDVGNYSLNNNQGITGHMGEGVEVGETS